MNIAYLLLGSNDGNREQWLKDCIHLIKSNCGEIIQQSHIYETAAWGIEDQPDFLNMAIAVETAQSPAELLVCVQRIEQELGRQREVKWGQRTLDIDILFYNLDIIDLPDLKVPHPYLHERRFALAPLNEIAPELEHPILNKTISQLLIECPDPLDMHLYK